MLYIYEDINFCAKIYESMQTDNMHSGGGGGGGGTGQQYEFSALS